MKHFTIPKDAQFNMQLRTGDEPSRFDGHDSTFLRK